jgi:hypothetical protein
MLRHWVPVAIVLLFTACAGQRVEVPVTADYNTITYEEIVEALKKRPMRSAYELIEYLRPKYLLPRMQTTVNQGVMRRQPVVYLNNVRFGTLNELTNINILQIHTIYYLKSTEATNRLGAGHEGGAILISTR